MSKREKSCFVCTLVVGQQILSSSLILTGLHQHVPGNSKVIKSEYVINLQRFDMAILCFLVGHIFWLMFGFLIILFIQVLPPPPFEFLD